MFHKVVVGVDGREGGKDAVVLAEQLVDPPARLVLANVYGAEEVPGHGGPMSMPAEREAAYELLAREREAATMEAESVVCHHSLPGRALRDLAEQKAADLLVVGSCHRGSLGRVLLGDDTLAALNGAPCGVAIAPRGYLAGEHRIETIGVGHDGSVESELALRAARDLAARHRAEIRLLAVVSLQGVPAGMPAPIDWTAETERVMRDERERLVAIDDVESHVVYGDPGQELASFAAGVDLLIVGSRGQGRIGRWLSGSVSTYLARRARCPLLVLPRCLTGPTLAWEQELSELSPVLTARAH